MDGRMTLYLAARRMQISINLTSKRTWFARANYPSIDCISFVQRYQQRSLLGSISETFSRLRVDITASQSCTRTAAHTHEFVILKLFYAESYFYDFL